MRVRLLYRLAQGLIWGVSQLFYGYRIEGREHVPPTGPVIVAANHKSYLDPPLVGASLTREIRYFAKRELFRIPVFGALIEYYGAIPVQREGFDRRGVTRALDLLARGEGLLVFPEGTRIRRPGYGDPKEGVALLALKAGVPVIPCHIRSSWEPRRRPWRRIPIRVRFGPALNFASAGDPRADRARYAGVAAQVLAAIRDLGEFPAANRD